MVIEEILDHHCWFVAYVDLKSIKTMAKLRYWRRQFRAYRANARASDLNG